MKTNSKETETPRKQRIRALGALVAVPALLAVGAGAVFSLRASEARQSHLKLNVKRASAEEHISRPEVRNARSLPQGGQIRPLTQDEAQQLADGIRELLNRSQEGLEPLKHANGAVSVDLKERFQNVALAKETNEGGVTVACVDSLESAAEFLEIQPHLITGGAKSSGPKQSLSAPKQEKLHIR